MISSKYLRATDGNLDGNTSERRGGMAIVITRVCVCVGGGVKYDFCDGMVEEEMGVRRMFLN